MSNELSMSFSQVHPFIRYIHKLTISRGEYPIFTRAYDHRLFYVSKGEGVMYIGNATYPLTRGNLVLWQSGIDYHMDSVKGMEFLAVNFDYSQSNRNKDYPIPPDKSALFRPSELLEPIRFTDTVSLNSPVFLNDMNHVEDTLLKMLHEYDTKMIYYYERLSGLFLNVLVYVVRDASTTRKYDINTSQKVNEIIAFIQAHYKEDISNISIGRLFSYHPNYINKLMGLYTEKSLHQYLLNYRISKAIDLIFSTNDPISDIAYDVGFKDLSHFSKLFKQKTGLSPSAFRRAQTRKQDPPHPAEQ